MLRCYCSFWIGVLGVFLLGSACTEKPPSEEALVPFDILATEDGVEDTVIAWPLCEPGTVKECLGEEGSQSPAALLCNETGDAYEEGECQGVEGTPTWCVDGGCWECVPGARICGDGNSVLECNPSGVFEQVQECSDVSQGLVCNGGNCVRLCELNQKFNSYIGCEYWAVDLDNAFVKSSGNSYFDAAGAQFAIVVGNPNEEYPAEVSITIHDGESEIPLLLDSSDNPLDLSPIPPGELRVFNVPRRDIDGSGITQNAFRLETSVPVTAHQFNPLDNTTQVYSNDASLLLPTDVLGKYYIGMTREQTFDSLRSFITIVATQDDTQVAVTVTAPTQAANGLEPLKDGETGLFTLSRYEVLNLETDNPGTDLTGSVVVSTKEVAVFGGSEAANAPNTASCSPEGFCVWDGETPCTKLEDCLLFNTCCADHLEQQLFPFKTWGMNFIATKSKARGEESDIWRIIAAENDTVVSTDPSQATIPVLDKGEWFEFESKEDFVIAGTNPIMVGQFLAAEDAPNPNFVGVDPGGGNEVGDAGIGDPAFLLLVAQEQFRKEYVLFVPTAYEEDYANVVAPFEAEVLFDGIPIPKADYRPVSSEYRVATLLLSDGKHTLKSEQPFGVIAYGFDDYVSYGYPGGLDLKDLGLVNETGE